MRSHPHLFPAAGCGFPAHPAYPFDPTDTVAGLALTRSIATLVYDVSATDPLTFTGAAALLMAVGVMACLVPAARASRIDPAVALREE
jgi:ABC-type lipoprotein release transport system permease subunit